MVLLERRAQKYAIKQFFVLSSKRDDCIFLDRKRERLREDGVTFRTRNQRKKTHFSMYDGCLKKIQPYASMFYITRLATFQAALVEILERQIVIPLWLAQKMSVSFSRDKKT